MADSALVQLLASFVPKLIQKRSIHDSSPITSPVSEEFEAVVLFADISGFTTLTEELAKRGPVGVETLARHAQATAFTSWEEVTDGGLPRIAGGVRPTAAVARAQPTMSTAPPVSSADRLSSVEDRQPSVPLWPAIGATPAAIDGPSKPGGASGASETNSVPGLSAPGTAGGTGLPTGAAPSEPKPGAEAGPSVAAALADMATGTVSGARLRSPLLLVDPEFHSLSALDLELERSAPLRPVQIRYGERALNREIAALWLTNPTFPCRDVQVDLQDNQVAISGRVTGTAPKKWSA